MRKAEREAVCDQVPCRFSPMVVRRLSAARRSFGITAQMVHAGGNILDHCFQADVCRIF